jgi:hypothetical protein
MNWTVIWRDRAGEEKRAKTPSLEAAFIEADHNQNKGLDIVHIEGPDGKLISASKSEAGASHWPGLIQQINR